MPSPGVPRQLAFGLPHRESFAREDFLEGPSNATALAMIEAWPDWPHRIMVLVGAAGTGKSHLAAIWAAVSGARLLSARQLAAIDPPAALATGALVIEDLVPGNFDEKVLFHLLNLAREEDSFVLITMVTPPAGWALHTPDLASRLRALPVIELLPPEERLLRAVLVKLFADRQLHVDDTFLAYLLSRIERSVSAARAAVDKLDREALRLKRPVNRLLAADVLDWETLRDSNA